MLACGGSAGSRAGWKDAVLQFGKRVVGHERREMGHRKRAVEFVEIGFGEIEKLEEQAREIFRAIRFHFQAHGVAAAGPPQFLLDAAQEVFGFFVVDVEIAVARDAKGVHAVEDQAGEKIGDVLFDQRREIDVIPRLVALCRAACGSGAARRAAPARWRGAARRRVCVFARTSRLWLLFRSCGNGWLASTASGVSIGKTSS